MLCHARVIGTNLQTPGRLFEAACCEYHAEVAPFTTESLFVSVSIDVGQLAGCLVTA